LSSPPVWPPGIMSSSPRAGRLGLGVGLPVGLLGLGVGLPVGLPGLGVGPPGGRLGVGGALLVGGRLGLGIGAPGGRLGLGVGLPAGRLGIELLLERPGIMPLTDEPMLPAVSFTCSTTRLMTLRAGAGAALAAARRGLALRVEAFAALRVPALRLDERAFDPRLLAELRRFGDAARFFDAFLLERFFDDRLLDERLDERFFEDFFEDFEDLRDERFLEAAIWFLLLTRLDRDAASYKVAKGLRCRGNLVAPEAI
jgi:hypothetical protein